MRNHLIVQTSGTQDFSQQVTWPIVFNKTSNSFSSQWSQHLISSYPQMVLKCAAQATFCLKPPQKGTSQGLPYLLWGVAYLLAVDHLSPSLSQTHESPAGRVTDPCPHKALEMSNFLGCYQRGAMQTCRLAYANRGHPSSSPLCPK